MAKLIQVSRNQVKACEGCGTPIAFHANRDGRRYPVEVHCHPKLGMVYRSGIGAHGNLTPWHDCAASRRSLEAHQARRKQEELDARRNEVAARYLPRLMEVAQNFTPERYAEAEALGLEYKAALEAAGVQ